MNRRPKNALLAVLAMLAVPVMSACVMLPGTEQDTDGETTQSDSTGEAGPSEDGTDADGGGDDSAVGDTRFTGTDDFFGQLDASMDTCEQTDEQPLPEGLDDLEPKLVGAVYAFCTFSDGGQLVAILLADPSADMASTQLASDRDVSDFKREGGVTSLAIGGNWLITSPDDQLVEDAVTAFGGSVY